MVDVLLSIKAMLNGADMEKGDVNGDGMLTLLDVLQIMKMIV